MKNVLTLFGGPHHVPSGALCKISIFTPMNNNWHWRLNELTKKEYAFVSYAVVMKNKSEKITMVESNNHTDPKLGRPKPSTSCLVCLAIWTSVNMEQFYLTRMAFSHQSRRRHSFNSAVPLSQNFLLLVVLVTIITYPLKAVHLALEIVLQPQQHIRRASALRLQTPLTDSVPSTMNDAITSKRTTRR